MGNALGPARRAWRHVAVAGLLAVVVAACAPPPADVEERPTTAEELRAQEGQNPYRRLWWRGRPVRSPQPTTTTTTEPPAPAPAPVPAPVPPPSSVAGSPLGVAGNFRIAFSDDFDGGSLGPAWYPNRWFATNCSAGAGNPEEQWYTTRPENVSVSGGVLHLTARRENYSCGEWGGGTKRYTSGWVQTGGSRDKGGRNVAPGFTCGVGCFVEARVKMPAGGMTFPAVWMLPVRESQGNVDARYPERPEIDILEFWETWSHWEHHIHSVCGNGNVDQGATFRGPDAASGFHTVGLYWRSPNQLEWYVDGVRAWTYTGCGVPGAGERMYIILNHAIGHAAPSPSSSEPFPKDMQVDYVRAWPS